MLSEFIWVLGMLVELYKLMRHFSENPLKKTHSDTKLKDFKIRKVIYM